LNNKVNEKSTTITFLAISIIVAMILSPKNIFFLGNFAYYWLPQAIVYILLFVLKIRLAVIAGASLSLTSTLILYWLWLLSNFASLLSNSLALLVYSFIIPGAFIGALIYGLIIRTSVSSSYVKVICIATIATLTASGIGSMLLFILPMVLR